MDHSQTLNSYCPIVFREGRCTIWAGEGVQGAILWPFLGAASSRRYFWFEGGCQGEERRGGWIQV